MLPMSNEDSIELTKAIMSILDSWGLAASETIALLDLPPKTPTRALRRYRENTAFPESPGTQQRLEHIVGIYDALRTTYPHNPSMGVLWMKQSNQRFNHRPPVQVLVEEGLEGMIKVRIHLDCTYDWEINP